MVGHIGTKQNWCEFGGWRTNQLRALGGEDEPVKLKLLMKALNLDEDILR